MKKFLFLAAALIAMGCGISSCSNEAEVTKQAPKLTKLVFTVAQDAQTRATWGGTNNCTPMFEDGEFVSLFSENNENVKLTAHVDGEGNVTLEGEGVADDNLYFVYPWDEWANTEEGPITSYDYDGPYGFTQGQVYPSDKYPSNALSLAKSTDGGASAIRFQGLMAIIKFTPAADCRGRIRVNAGASVILDDILAINPAGPSIEGSTGAVTSPKMDFPDVSFNFTADTPYYIALHPFTMSAGGTISFIDNGGDETALYTAPAGGKDFVAGKIYSLKYGSTGGSVVFAKNDWTDSGNTLTATKDGITITLTRSSSNDITKASTGAITFPSATEDETMTIKVTNASDAQLPCNLTNSATDMTLTGDGSWTLTYSSSPVGWLTTGGLAFIGLNIPKTATFTVDY